MQTKTELLKQIKDEVLNLKESPLYSYRTKNKYFPVIGEGSHDAKIMFVGEAPGRRGMRERSGCAMTVGTRVSCSLPRTQ